MNLLFLGSFPTDKLTKLSKGRISSFYNISEPLITGLRSNNEVKLKVLTSPDIASFPIQKAYIKKHLDENQNVLSLSLLNIPVIKQIWIILTLFLYSSRIIKKNEGKTTVIIPYLVFHHVVAQYLLKLCFRDRINNIILVPDIFFPNKWFAKILNRISETLGRRSDAFILYTNAMANHLCIQDKPYIVIEGFKKIEEYAIRSSYDVFKIVYTGSLNLQYGIRRLLDSMSYINESNIELHLYGDGNAVELIELYSQNDKRIKLWGKVGKNEATGVMYSANLLINPRNSTDGKYVAYSFPSKNIDYLSSGIPSVLCKLPGMPIEYYDFFIDGDDGSAEKLAKAILSVYSMSIEERRMIGNKARCFIKDRMDIKKQGRKIVEMIKSL